MVGVLMPGGPRNVDMNKSTLPTSKSSRAGFVATPADLRHIVLAYLCDNCYADTAQVFARDSAMRELNKDGDEVLITGENGILDAQVVRKVKSRKDIKMRILSGQINDAIDLLKRHFPAVLEPPGRVHDLASRFDPAHLFLNLRIQNFIEQSRTISLPWPDDDPISLLSSSQHSSPSTKFSLLPDAVTIPSVEDEGRKNRLLDLMHELYVLTHALSSPMDRATYLTELSTVGGLLAYPIPEKSREMRKYLAMARREAVAHQINEALLFRSNAPFPGVVELSARHTALLFATLSSLGQTLPAPELRPPGFDDLLSGNTLRTRDSKGSTTSKDKDFQEAFPTFDLKIFLGPEPV